MKVVITGSRTWTDVSKIEAVLSKLPLDTEIIHGGAAGADYLSGVVAKKLGLKVRVERARWDEHGKAAGFIRNVYMLDAYSPNKVIAFWDGVSRGTAHTIKNAEARNIPVEVWQ